MKKLSILITAALLAGCETWETVDLPPETPQERQIRHERSMHMMNMGLSIMQNGLSPRPAPRPYNQTCVGRWNGYQMTTHCY